MFVEVQWRDDFKRQLGHRYRPTFCYFGRIGYTFGAFTVNANITIRPGEIVHRFINNSTNFK